MRSYCLGRSSSARLYSVIHTVSACRCPLTLNYHRLDRKFWINFTELSLFSLCLIITATGRSTDTSWSNLWSSLATQVNLAVGTDLQGLRTLCCWSPCPLSPSAGGDRMGETTCWEVKGDTYLNICSISPPGCRTICGAVSPLQQKQNYRKVYNEMLNYIINQVESMMMSYKDRIQITAANRSLITAGCLTTNQSFNWSFLVSCRWTKTKSSRSRLNTERSTLKYNIYVWKRL